jgi:modulator of FtsH protease HflK
MVWEKPPGRRGPQVPEVDIQEIVRKLKEQYRSLPFSRGPLLGLVLAVLLIILGITSYYKVEAEEIAVVLRFGKFIGTAGPGPHFKIPFGVDNVKKVVTGRVHQSEYGYRTAEAGVRSTFVEKGYEQEALMLSGDLNVVNLQWTVQYKIQDPVDYLFRVSGVEKTLDDISESVMRRIVGNRYADEILTVGRASIAEAARKEIQEILDQYKTGLRIVTVALQNVNAPNPVRAAFNEVNEAGQEKDRMINDAQQAYNQKIPKAVGEARQTITQAEGYALERVNRSQGEVSRFLNILAEYQKAPDVTRSRMYLESMESLLGRINQLYVIDQDQKGLLPFFDIGRFAGPEGKGPLQGAPAQQK